MTLFTLTLVRHGETSANRERIIQGQNDVPLSEIGLKQSKFLGSWLKNQQYSHVFSSDLSRAKQTADTVLEENETFKKPVITDIRLRERCFGVLEGHPFQELLQLAAQANVSHNTYMPDGAETFEQVRQRAINFFCDLCRQVIEEDNKNFTLQRKSEKEEEERSDVTADMAVNVLVITHGCLLRELLLYFVDDLCCGLPIGKEQILPVSPNTGVSKFTVYLNGENKPNVACLLLYSDEHLAGADIPERETCFSP